MFIVYPDGGLCNQLITIVNGMLLGMKYRRDVYIDGFKIDYKKKDRCDINLILDIDKINIFLIDSNIVNFTLIKSTDVNVNEEKYKMQNINYETIQKELYINNHIEENINKDVIYLGNIISLDIYKSFGYIWNDKKNFYHMFMKHIVFQDVFYEIKESIKKSLDLQNYSCYHVRIEDDCINYCSKMYNMSIEEYNKKLLNFYDKEIQNINKQIYICSGITHFDNTINLHYYQE